MGWYVIRRLGQAALTILGVMIITFLLFRQVAGDVAAANLGPKATESRKAAWRHRYGYDLPDWINCHRQLMIEDRTAGPGQLAVDNVAGVGPADALALRLSDTPGPAAATMPGGKRALNVLVGRYVAMLSDSTPINRFADGAPLAPASASPTRPVLEFTLSDGSMLSIDLTGVQTCGQLLDRINSDSDNGGRVEARLSTWRPAQLVNSQFFHHLVNSVTFQSRSLKDNQKLTQIISERAGASLAIQLPAFVMEWLLGLAIAALVAYYRGTWIDRAGVFLSVLGMCIPFLAFMIYGQWLVFAIAPRHAFGLLYRGNVYVPIAIMVLAGLGWQVRFYRTIILDETNRDYVRTALAKGVPLPGVLFRHVMKNCMLPILTSLIMSIPFLILGGLLIETYFGIPGLGDLMLTSINNRDEPVMNGLVFLTALIYTLSVLITDLCYAVFDPRVRLQ